MKKWSLEYQQVIKTHLCTYLQDGSYISDISDSSDDIDSSDSSDSSDSNDGSENSDQTTLYTKKFNLPKTYLPTYLCDSSYYRDSRDSSDGSNGSDGSDSSDSSDMVTKQLCTPKN